MKIASTTSRYLLGLIFTVFGANGFLHFIPAPPPVSPYAAQFLLVTSGSHFLTVIFLAQLLAGIALLADVFVPLALVVLAAELVNILNFHATMDPGGVGLALVTTLLWILAAQNYRESLRGLLVMRPASTQAGDRAAATSHAHGAAL